MAAYQLVLFFSIIQKQISADFGASPDFSVISKTGKRVLEKTSVEAEDNKPAPVAQNQQKENSAELLEKKENPAVLQNSSQLAKNNFLATQEELSVADNNHKAESEIAKTGSNGSQLDPAQIISQTNEQRVKLLGAGFMIAENQLLNRAAELKIQDMVNGGYFAHVSPKGYGAEHFISQTGYKIMLYGENLAMGDFKNSEAVVNGWMDSSGHRENILRTSFQEIGVAARFGMFLGREQWIAVQIFATPQSVCGAVDSVFGARLEQLEAKNQNENRQLEILALAIDEQSKLINNLKSVSAGEGNINYLIDQINLDIAGYNARRDKLAAAYGDYRRLVQNYNAQVAKYNQCLASWQ